MCDELSYNINIMPNSKRKSPSTKKRDRMRMMKFNMKKKEELLKSLEITNYERSIDIDKILIDTVVEAEESFFSSTPKKFTGCEECFDKSQCVDCIIMHMLGRQVVARALFDDWPPDRLHLLL